MGLFIGASILTILELFDYIYEVRFGIPLGEMTTCGCPHPALMPRAKALHLHQSLHPLPLHGYCLSPSPRYQGGMKVREGKPQSGREKTVGCLHKKGGGEGR